MERGHVAYLAFENPDDTRVRFLAAANQHGVHLRDIAGQIEVFDVRKKPEQLCGELAVAGPFALILVDTLQAFFDGKSSNDNAELVDFLRRVRPMTKVRGAPAVIVSAHPVKNAGDDNLVPYGAGAILNEVDGNFTLTRHGKRVELHWQGKLRGLDFHPLSFQIETVCTLERPRQQGEANPPARHAPRRRTVRRGQGKGREDPSTKQAASCC